MSSDSPLTEIRPAEASDAPALARLMEAYMRETYRDSWHGSAEALLRDGFGREFEVHVARTREGRVVGLVAWRRAYDLHHCVAGAEIFDMYVVPEFRTRSLGPALVCAVAAEVRRRGGAFIRGQAVDDPAVRRLYGRVAVCSPGVECTIGGRALRRLADLAGSPARTLARSLPEKSWNYEA
ncbi:MAG TPA: GNAT family N-acetyltransferase [Longimicrobiaceae bacterium]